MISNLTEIGFWRRLFHWKAVCSDIDAAFASIKADLDKANLQLHAYEQQLSASKAELDQHKNHLHEAHSELAQHRVKDRRTREGHRTLLHFIAQAHGLKVKAVVAFGILLSCYSWGAFPPPFQHNPVTTNTLGSAPSTLYFLGWNGTKPAWGIPVGSNDVVIAGAGVTVVTNYVTGGVTYTVASSNAVVAAGSISTVSTNVVSGGIVYTVSSPDPTNQATVVSNGITGRIIKSLGITVDGGGQVLTSGVKGYLEVPVACTIISATILADQSGSIAIETWRTNSSSMPPTRAGVLFTNYLTTAQASTDSTLTGNTSLSLATQDRIGFNIITNALSVTRVTLQLRVQP